MYKIPQRTSTSIQVYDAIEGETIEQEIERLLNNGVPIESEKAPIFTKPSEGVPYGTDIRGDRWDKAIEINDKINSDIDKIRNLKIVKNEEKEEKKDDNPGEKSEEKGSI